jgi:hypothetical protein
MSTSLLDVGIESSNFSILVKGKEGDKVDFKQEL